MEFHNDLQPVNKRPIGVFDSGVGGLSVCHAIKHVLPDEALVYFADLAFSPYGDKGQLFISDRSEYIADFLVERGCKAIVVACNTATVSTVSNLRDKLSIPIVGVEPGLKPAALNTKTGVVGVLATEQTLNSASYQMLESIYSKKIKIKSLACPELVSLVESLRHNTAYAQDIVEAYIRPLVNQHCDQIVLGCTHFSFLKSTIQDLAGSHVNIVDTAMPVAMELKRRIYELSQQNIKGSLASNEEFWASGDALVAARTISALWGNTVEVYGHKSTIE